LVGVVDRGWISSFQARGNEGLEEGERGESYSALEEGIKDESKSMPLWRRKGKRTSSLDRKVGRGSTS
jgi:hypothetical protein